MLRGSPDHDEFSEDPRLFMNASTTTTDGGAGGSSSLKKIPGTSEQSPPQWQQDVEDSTPPILPSRSSSSSAIPRTGVFSRSIQSSVFAVRTGSASASGLFSTSETLPSSVPGTVTEPSTRESRLTEGGEQMNNVVHSVAVTAPQAPPPKTWWRIPHLWNAGKYLSSILVVWQMHLTDSRYAWVMISGFSAAYNLYWDVVMDWNLGSFLLFQAKAVCLNFRDFLFTLPLRVWESCVSLRRWFSSSSNRRGTNDQTQHSNISSARSWLCGPFFGFSRSGTWERGTPRRGEGGGARV